jgi:hypothetical protein
VKKRKKTVGGKKKLNKILKKLKRHIFCHGYGNRISKEIGK